MKTKVMIVAAIMAFTAVASLADGNPAFVVIGQKPGTFKVIYKAEQASNVKMNIINSVGRVIYTETMSRVSGFIRPVNLTGLEFGEYVIQLDNGKEKQSQKVVYSNPVADVKTLPAVANEKEVANMVHVARMNESGMYLLGIANAPGEKINVKIYDGELNLVHNRTVKLDRDYAVVYNLKQVDGTPTFEVSDANGAVKTIKY